MNKFLLIILCYFFLTSCQNIQNVEKTEQKNTTKEFSISEFTSFFKSINFNRVVSIFIVTFPSWENKFLLKISRKNQKKIALKLKFRLLKNSI